MLAAAGVWLGAASLTTAVARAQVEEAPATALAWRGDHADALARLAEETLSEGGARTQDEAEALARRALIADPLNIRALRLLGTIADRKGEEARAETLMQLTSRRSLRDGLSHLWLFNKRMAERDYAAAALHADALMRRPAYREQVGYMLSEAAANDPEAIPPLVSRLAPRPPWRITMVRELASRPNPSPAFGLLMALEEAGSPATDEEAHLVVGRMIIERRVPEAYVAWVQLLPQDAVKHLGDIYDGGFDGLPGAAPFNWTLGKDPASWAERAEGPGGGKALYVRHSGGSRSALAQQILMLSPGAYRLSARSYAEAAGRDDQLRWEMVCIGGQPGQLTQLPTSGRATDWQTFSADFVVPDSGCDAQVLMLIGRPGEKTGYANAWVDDVTIQRRRPAPADPA